MEKVIRDESMLGLGEDALALARKLMSMMDKPVMFIVNSTADKSYAGNNGEYQNLFCVSVQPQEEHSEYERIILQHLYRGVLEQKRTLHPCPVDKYMEKLQAIKDINERETRIRLYMDMIVCISVIASTIEAEIYLEENGIETSIKTKEKHFDHSIGKLQEYLEKQKGLPKLTWYIEQEIRNIIDFSRTSTWNERYRNKIRGLLKKTYPAYKVKEYLSRLDRLVQMQKEAQREFSGSEILECSEWIMEQIISIMGIEHMVTLKRFFHMEGSYPSKYMEASKMYSFIPGGIDNEQMLLDAVRVINSGIVLVQEFHGTLYNKDFPNAHVNLIDSEHIQAYADGNRNSGYFISVSRGLIEYVNYEMQNINLENEGLSVAISLLGEPEVLSRFYKYVLYNIGTHEYAHILKGHCDSLTTNLNERILREEEADEYSYEITSPALFLQYRPKTENPMKEGKIMIKNALCDKQIFDAAHNWSKRMRERR